jgi:hypothetical protein
MIPEPMYREMIQPVGLRTGKPGETGYGLTTFVWKAPAGIHYGHSGFFPGYLTNVEYVKELKAGIAVQLNSDQGPGRSLHGFMIDYSRHYRTESIKGKIRIRPGRADKTGHFRTISDKHLLPNKIL